MGSFRFQVGLRAAKEIWHKHRLSFSMILGIRVWMSPSGHLSPLQRPWAIIVRWLPVSQLLLAHSCRSQASRVICFSFLKSPALLASIISSGTLFQSSTMRTVKKCIHTSSRILTGLSYSHRPGCSAFELAITSCIVLPRQDLKREREREREGARKSIPQLLTRVGGIHSGAHWRHRYR